MNGIVTGGSPGVGRASASVSGLPQLQPDATADSLQLQPGATSDSPQPSRCVLLN